MIGLASVAIGYGGAATVGDTMYIIGGAVGWVAYNAVYALHLTQELTVKNITLIGDQVLSKAGVEAWAILGPYIYYSVNI